MPDRPDTSEFAREAQAYHAELLAHCYRMTGARSDAEDALQNALVKAWRSYAAFEGRSSLRTWLYKITTNACLDVIASRKGRTMPEVVAPDQAEDALWLEPFPAPDERLVHREAVRLAFVIALQVLPPKQRAALILFDVVGMSADEVATTLDTTVAAVNSALQRARTVLAAHPRAHKAPIGGRIGDLLGKYLAAWEAGDARGLVALLRDDAVLSMPPIPLVGRGPDEIARILEERVFARGPIRLLPATFNGAPAFAAYLDGSLAAITVLDIADGRIVAIQSFLEVDPGTYGLPVTLAAPIALVPGAQLDRYHLEYVLGGAGQIWCAHDRALDRDVALELVRPAGDAAARSQLLRDTPDVTYDVTPFAGGELVVTALDVVLVDGQSRAGDGKIPVT